MLLSEWVWLNHSILPGLVSRYSRIKELRLRSRAASRTLRVSIASSTAWSWRTVTENTPFHRDNLSAYLWVVSSFRVWRSKRYDCGVIIGWDIAKPNFILNKWLSIFFLYILQGLPSLVLPRVHGLKFFTANPLWLVVLSPLRSRKKQRVYWLLRTFFI